MRINRVYVLSEILGRSSPTCFNTKMVKTSLRLRDMMSWWIHPSFRCSLWGHLFMMKSLKSENSPALLKYFISNRDICMRDYVLVSRVY